MNKVLFKDLLREIRRSWARFLSIFAIVMVSVAFFSGIRATAPDMRYTADQYFDQYNMMDIRVLSTFGLSQEDIDAIAAVKDVQKVQPGYFADVVTTINSSEIVFRVHSLPTTVDQNTINRIELTEGRYPEKSGECVIEDADYMILGLKVGDTIHVSSGKETPVTEGTLGMDTFTIVGKATTPYYLTYDKGTTEIGSGKINTFMMIPEQDFIYPCYTEALVTAKGASSLNTYSAKYDDLVEGITVALENLGVDRCAINLASMKADAEAQLADAKEKYNAAKEDFDTKIAQGEADLDDAHMKLVEGEAKLAEEKESFAQQTEMAEAQIRAAKKQVAEGEADYAEAETEYNQMMAEYGDDLDTLNESATSLSNIQSEALARRTELEQQLQDPDLTDEEREDILNTIAMYDELLSITGDSVGTVIGLNDLTQQSITGAQQQLADSRAQLDAAHAEIARSERKLADSKKEANEQFAQAEADLAQGWADYEQGKKDLEQQRTDGQAQLDAAMEEIVRGEDEIERINSATWYVLDRHKEISFADYEATTKSVDSIANVFPIFFFLVAALVCLTTMTRLVAEQRVYIGTYKALGYDSRSIALKYVLYAALASTLGAVAGFLIGMRIFPSVIYQSWLLKYMMPQLQYTNQIPLIIISVIMGISVTTVTAYIACNKELVEMPSMLMRPKAPKAGKIILMERITFLWKRLSFSQKVTARNIFRYKRRFFMTIIGIAGCTALLLAGFGLNNSISQVVSKQFKEIFAYDLNMRYAAGITDEGKADVEGILQNEPEVESYMSSTELNATCKSTGSDISTTLIVVQDTARLGEFIALRNSTTQDPIPLTDDGVVITEKLSKELGIGVGDAFELDNSIGARKKVIVAAVTENYVFHYIYMTDTYYHEVYRLAPKPNSLMIKLSSDSSESENRIAGTLIGNENVASVLFYSTIATNFADTVKSLNSIVIVIIACAGLLAFIVLYNLTNINICERIREIATIKVLGFYNREVHSYVFRENLLLTIIGAVIGLGLGILLHRFIMVSIEQDAIMFGHYIKGWSFGYSLVITIVFAELVSLFMSRRLKNIPMVESLKSVE